MKIVLLGGLGYIGSKIIEFYRNRKGPYQITVVDRTFIPERIALLPLSAIYIQGDMGDADLMKRVCEGADVVYILAAEVEAETSKEREQVMWVQNYENAVQVADICDREKTRVIFPSSANVFGGNHAEPGTVFTEADDPAPKYPYAETKVAVENFLRDRGGNYVILRFGTNYGWADGIRFNLVVNLFVKKALQGDPLTVHGNGLNSRPFCSTTDCARAAILASEREGIEGKLYQVISQNVQIGEIAAMVKAIINPEIEIQFIAKEAVFSSYKLSGERISRELDFEYIHLIPEAIRDMKEALEAVMP